MGEGEVSAESMEKTHFWGLRGRETRNRYLPAPLETPWTKTA